MSKTKIEWTQATWNPVTGCTKISPGCANCYAEKMTRRLVGMGTEKYKNGFWEVVCHSPALPKKLKRKKVIFVNSMSDLFHESVPDGFIYEIVDEMRRHSRIIFQVLTKRPERLREMKIDWPENVYVGVSVESRRYLSRVFDLLKSTAKKKFASIEPLLGDLGDVGVLSGMDWVIVGCETGRGARLMKPEWYENIWEQVFNMHGIPVFLKKWDAKGIMPVSEEERLFPDDIAEVMRLK